MVKIRLKRFGTKKKPVYRIVVMESSARRDGRTIDEIGFYNPRANEGGLQVNAEAAKKWISNGAQPTDTAKSLLRKANVLENKSA